MQYSRLRENEESFRGFRRRMLEFSSDAYSLWLLISILLIDCAIGRKFSPRIAKLRGSRSESFARILRQDGRSRQGETTRATVVSLE